jgi:hypothetical protein
LGAQIIVALAEEAGQTASAIVDFFVDLWLDHLDHRADEWTRRVLLPAVAPGDAHVFDFRLVAEVSVDAFDGCINIGHAVSDGPSPYFDVGFRLEDAGWWFWTYST